MFQVYFLNKFATICAVRPWLFFFLVWPEKILPLFPRASSALDFFPNCIAQLTRQEKQSASEFQWDRKQQKRSK